MLFRLIRFMVAKVKLPLFSGEVRGQFARNMIFRSGGVVTKMFSPRNPDTPAQQAQRQWMKENYMTYLTELVARGLFSLLDHLHDDRYSLLSHLHDDRYSLLSHLHDESYSQLGHEHGYLVLYAAHGLNGTLGAGATMELPPFYFGLNAIGYNAKTPGAGVLKSMRVQLNGAQPGSGTLVFTTMIANAASSLVVTVPINGGIAEYTDVTHTPAVVAGSLVRVQVKNNAGAVSGLIGAVSFVFEGSTTG